MSSIAEIQAERQTYQEQLDLVLGQIRDDPDNVELKALHSELKEFVDLLDENIAELKAKQAPKPEVKPAAPPPEPAKWSKENHPAFKKAAPPVEEKEEAPVNYQVNDTVLAKWISGDKAFYPARITSITGSSTDPIYIVKFKTYDTTDTLRSRDIRPISNKRKADAPPSASATPVATAPAPGVVSSAGATMYPEAQKESEAEKDAAKAPKPKKIKANKELEAGKSKWQDFNAKSKFGKSNKKDSMFRTPEGIHGRVGFTGSGKAMRKDPTRSRHVYQVNEELD
ncbi:hypothetical protein T069G_02807 [Trichoderma breve]|uniref:Tudor domain-containing protein n=1 Tax=Trichoderma breve TaxID=2034170 RepID=A0A9W9BL29_9HYPO|nr:hypothetical protein T069G_02807 [Trichoderma breve]KAJ4861853.1 hypothetical protein T069G_02807 [Trichoderma breve]